MVPRRVHDGFMVDPWFRYGSMDHDVSMMKPRYRDGSILWWIDMVPPFDDYIDDTTI